MARKQMRLDPQTPARILMLVPHDPDDDPRVRWAIKMCTEIGPTHVIGYTNRDQCDREYDGRLYVERVNRRFLDTDDYQRAPKNPYPFQKYRRLHRLLRPLTGSRALRGLIFGRARAEAPSRPPVDPLSHGTWPLRWSRLREAMQDYDSNRERYNHYVALLRELSQISETLYARALAVSVVPRLIVCHDIYALIPAIRLRRQFGCPVLYDSHEIWPEAIPEAQPWLSEMVWHVERDLIRDADRVVTVNPRIAQLLERWYGIRGVASVPNAEPLPEETLPPRSMLAHPPTAERPLRFLLQCGACKGRGVERLLEQWVALDEPRAILQVRTPDHDFMARVHGRFRSAARAGRVAFPPPVTEDQLVEAAVHADVGIIPYPGPNLNHVYACPNKTSQYMQAGLALLYNSDMEYVTEVVSKHQCGLSYRLDQPETLRQSVAFILDHPQSLHEMQSRARQCALTWFNWQVQSADYRKAIRELYDRGGLDT